MIKRQTIEDFQKVLGEEYSIKTIDYERCLYRDLKNGFDIEISGMKSRKKKPLTIYLWNMKEWMYTLVEVYNVERTPEAISVVSEQLKHYAEKLNSDNAFLETHMAHCVSCGFDEIKELDNINTKNLILKKGEVRYCVRMPKGSV